MSFESDALALDGIISLWAMKNINGTSVPDLGPGNIPLTVTDPIPGAVLTTMGGSSLRGNGTSTRATTGNLPAAHPLRLPNGAPFSIFCWYTLTTAPGTARNLMGRNGQQVMRVSTGGQVNPIAQGVNISSVTTVPSTEAAFYVVTWNGKELRVYVNGVLEGAQPGTATTGDDPAPFEVLSQSGALWAPGDIDYIGVVNRDIGRGTSRSLYLAGAPAPYVVASNLYEKQSINAAVLSTPEAERCFSCGGKRHSNQARVVRGTEVRDIACYGGRATGIPTVTPSLSTPNLTSLQIGSRAAVTIYDMLAIMAGRPHTGKQYYHDGSNWVVNFATTDAPTWVGGGVGGAFLHRLSGSDDDSWLRRIAIASAEQFMATQNPGGTLSHPGTYGNQGSPSTSLGAHYLFETYLWLYDSLGRGTRKRWLDSFIYNGQYWRNLEKTYYTNGNIECGQLLNNLLMAIITKDDSWMADYEYQLDFLANPPVLQTGNNNNSSGDNLGKFGWYTVNGTTATKGLPSNFTGDGSDKKGFFAEGKNDPTSFPGWAPGYDPYYTQVQLAFMLRVHQWSYLKFPGGDIRVLRYVNMLWNLLIEKVNTTGATVNTIGAWQIDGRTGLDGVVPASRNPTFIRPFSNAAGFYLAANPSLRSTNPIPATWPAQQWAANEIEQRNNRSALGTYLRGLGEMLIPWVTASPLWTPPNGG